MNTQLLSAREPGRDHAALEQAAVLLRAGRLVAIPTETVYGLAANALDPAAAGAIYAAKGRPSDNPLIVHIADLDALPPLVRTVPPAVQALAARFWPGPLTIILPKSDAVPYATTGGLETVAVRMPAHPVAAELIRLAGVPLAAPSANLSGRPSPTRAIHCLHDLDGRVDAILDGGPCEVGVESTVITLCTTPPRILRTGAVTLALLREVVPDIELDPAVFSRMEDHAKVSSPGMKYKHYAPDARVILVRGSADAFAAYAATFPDDCGVLCLHGEQPRFGTRTCIPYGHADDAESQAHGLFDALREVDTQGLRQVLVHLAPQDGVWEAVYNRLLRAAGFEEVVLASDGTASPYMKEKE